MWLTSTPKKYANPPEAYEEYRASLKKWYESLDKETMKAIKTRRRHNVGTGFRLYGFFSCFLIIYPVFLIIESTYRFTSETYKQAKGDNLGEKMADRSAAWKLLEAEKREVCCLASGNTHFNLTVLFTVCVGVYETRYSNLVWLPGQESRCGIEASS